MLDVAVAPLLWRLDHYGIELLKNARLRCKVRRAHLLAPGLHRSADAFGKSDVRRQGCCVMGEISSTKPYSDPRAARMVHR